MKNFLILAGLSAVLLYGSLCGTFYFFQQQFIFVPPGEIKPPPAHTDLREVSFTTSDGIRLEGWLLDNSGEKAVLFCHGNGANISTLDFYIRICDRLNLDALFFDYRGYGNSEGVIHTKEDLFRDTAAAYQFLQRKKDVNPSQIILWGRSLGGAAAVQLAQDNQLSAVILQSTFTSLEQVIDNILPILPTDKLLNFTYSNKDKIRGIDSPILIIHSVDDDLVPYSQGQKLYRLAKEPKVFLRLSGPHGSIPESNYSLLTDKLRSFLYDKPSGSG